MANYYHNAYRMRRTDFEDVVVKYYVGWCFVLRSLAYCPGIVQSIELNATVQHFPACPKPFFGVATLAQGAGALISEDFIPQWLLAENRANIRQNEVPRVEKRAWSPTPLYDDDNAPLGF